MSLVETLLDTAEADRDLLRKNAAMGDVASIARDLDFVLYAKDEKKAELVCSFVRDNSYGRASYEHLPENPEGSRHRIIVKVLMPQYEHAVCAVSGLMVCLAKLYDLEYDGWGSEIRKEPNQPLVPTPGNALFSSVGPQSGAAHL